MCRAKSLCTGPGKLWQMTKPLMASLDKLHFILTTSGFLCTLHQLSKNIIHLPERPLIPLNTLQHAGVMLFVIQTCPQIITTYRMIIEEQYRPPACKKSWFEAVFPSHSGARLAVNMTLSLWGWRGPSCWQAAARKPLSPGTLLMTKGRHRDLAASPPSLAHPPPGCSTMMHYHLSAVSETLCFVTILFWFRSCVPCKLCAELQIWFLVASSQRRQLFSATKH